MSAIAGADEAQDARAAELDSKFVDATKNFLSMRIAEAMTARTTPSRPTRARRRLRRPRARC